MFFPEKIQNITSCDKVLEIGPGGLPHPRSDVLLEKSFDCPDEAAKQRGLAPKPETNKKTIFYNGGSFPFENKEFDYIICSHVLEHVEDIDFFVKEIKRVGRKGYLEYPLIYYDYIYNFRVHENLLHCKDNTIYWMKKVDTPLDHFSEVQKFFYKALSSGYVDPINSFKEYFFEGFEWGDELKTERVQDLNLLCIDLPEIVFIPKPINLKTIFSRLLGFIKRIGY